MNILPVPSSRVSDTFVRQQLLEQMQQQQQNLTKLQDELSSGSQFTLPSDNPAAALTAVGLQSLVAQKQQFTTNLNTNSSYLSASDSALSQVNTLLDNVQGIALGAVGSTATAASQQAAAAQVRDTLNQIVGLANTQFSGRYLFAGSSTNVQPFATSSAGVEYLGNDANISSYADSGNLFTTNVTGNSAFGGFSSSVEGTTSLAPVLSADTPLADLNGGAGVTPGSISISDGTHTSVVNLSSAATVGDVVKMIESQPPPGRTVTVNITSTGLTVALDTAGGGSLSVSDIGGGKTAADLGIAGTLLGSTGPLVGSPVHPIIDLTTPLANILGSDASTTIASSGPNNNIVVQATANGPQDNGTNVVYVNDAWYQAAPGVTAGNEVADYNQTATPAVASLRFTGPNNDLIVTATTPGTAYNNVAVNVVNGGALGNNATASYDAGTKTLTLSVDGSGQTSTDALISAINTSGYFTAARDSSAEPNSSGGFISPTDIHNGMGNTYLTGTDPNTLAVHIQSGVSTANDVIQAINKTAGFSASLDISELGNDGSGIVTDALSDPASQGTLSGGSGVAFDQTGIQIVNGGKTYTVSFSGAKTIEDVLNDINTSGAAVLAQINASGTGINVQSRLSGSDFSIGENGGQTATQLGIRSFNANTALSDLNYGQGVQHVASTAATATVAGSGANNDLLFQATDSGTELNGVTVQFDNTGAAPGTESVSYNSAAKSLTFDVGPTTNANTIIHVLANDPVAGKLFTASLAPTDSGAPNNGTGIIDTTATGTLAGGTPGNFTIQRKDGVSFDIDLSSAKTIGDVLNLINNNAINTTSGIPIVAQLDATGNGIELVDDDPSTAGTLSVSAANGSAAAEDLGLVPKTSSTSNPPVAGAVATANVVGAGADNDLVFQAKGSGTALNGVTVSFVPTGAAPGTESVAYDSTNHTLTFDVGPTTTANTVINVLANDPVASQLFTASLAPTDGGAPNDGTGVIDTSAKSTLAGGTPDTLSGSDTNPQEVSGVFTALSRLQTALQNNDVAGIQRAMGLLTNSQQNLSFARAQLGANEQAVTSLQSQVQTETTQLQGALSNNMDVNMAQTISDLVAQQTAFQASLQVTALVSKLSLLNYL